VFLARRGKAADARQRWLRLRDFMHEALYDTVIGAGLACVDEALEEERVALWTALRACGRS
jgi:hypothetical protein